jgi:phosphoglycerate dehydrogenase-like enzyme
VFALPDAVYVALFVTRFVLREFPMTTDVLLVAKSDDEWPVRVIELLDRRLSVSRVDLHQGPETTADFSGVQIIVGGPSDVAPWVALCPNLQWIQSTWAGIDALSDVIPDSVVVTPLKDVFGQSMSEFVMGWILALERRILERASSKVWDERSEDGVHGKTMGILGTGSIGSAVAASARQFGIRCRGLNSDGRFIEGFETCFKAGDHRFFDGLDYVVSVLPKTGATDNAISHDALERLSPGSIVINIGRGNAINDDALSAALTNGSVRAAVLDVFREEPLPASHPYWQAPNVYITSHTSAPTLERFVADAMASNLERFLAGQPLLGTFDPDRGY